MQVSLWPALWIRRKITARGRCCQARANDWAERIVLARTNYSSNEPCSPIKQPNISFLPGAEAW